MKTFDGYRELFLGDYVLDERGRYVLRDDYETAIECRQALREKRERERIWAASAKAMALGMIGVVMLLLLAGRI